MAPGAKGAWMIKSEENVEMPDRLRRSAEMSANLEARMRHGVWDRARRLEFETEGLVEVRGETDSKFMPSPIAP
jgi:hypothetical protein